VAYDVAGLNHHMGAHVERLVRPAVPSSGEVHGGECTDCDWLPFEDPWRAGSGTSKF
jgi:hypothetical protein